MDVHASVKTETPFVPGGLLADGTGFHQKVVTLLAGVDALEHGTVLGKVTVGGATSAAKTGGNTGNGVLTLDVTTPVLAGARAGVYTARCIAAATNSGTFRVEDPDGRVIGDVAVGGTFSDKVKFVIADGATDFIVGDGFDITVAAGSGKYKLSIAAASDGSQYPDTILLQDTPASVADIQAAAADGGSFNKSYLKFGAGHSADTVAESLRTKGIYLR